MLTIMLKIYIGELIYYLQHMSSFIAGFLIQFAQLANLGPQNIFIIANSNTQQKRIIIVLACVITDILLIWMAVFGFINKLAEYEYIAIALKFGGSAFLIKYGFSSILKAIKNKEHIIKQSLNTSNKKFIVSALFASILTPYIILDNITISAVSQEYSKLPFFSGNVTASIVWFPFLCFAGGKFYHILKKNQTWRYINSFTGCIMIFMGLKLLFT